MSFGSHWEVNLISDVDRKTKMPLFSGSDVKAAAEAIIEKNCVGVVFDMNGDDVDVVTNAAPDVSPLLEFYSGGGYSVRLTNMVPKAFVPSIHANKDLESYGVPVVKCEDKALVDSFKKGLVVHCPPGYYWHYNAAMRMMKAESLSSLLIARTVVLKHDKDSRLPVQKAG